MEEFEETQPKRVPAKERFIKEIKGNETRVAIVVSVISVNRAEKTAVVADSTGEAIIRFNSTAEMRGFKEGKIFRIFAKPINLKPLTLQFELAQELKDFDANLFRKVKELWSSLTGDGS